MVAVLHDVLSSPPGGPQGPASINTVTLWELGAGKALGSVRDMMDSWQLVAINCHAPSGCELLAASVAGNGCASCAYRGLAWLCHHKLQARAAALSVLDTRHPGLTAQRFSLHHRSCFPRLAAAREHFVFTSHLDHALCAWDLRRMSVPLHQQSCRLDDKTGTRLEHQALSLVCSDDVLLGRAANGSLFAWDLSVTLGWQDGSMTGAWEALDHVHEWDVWELEQGAQPLCLTSLPLPVSCEPSIVLLNSDGRAPLTLLAASSVRRQRSESRACGDRQTPNGGHSVSEWENDDDEAWGSDDDDGLWTEQLISLSLTTAR
ncbi:hypothetical protein V8C86DRAFT_2598098 [Haematococcus lacustris]